jgi:hypothetical protein
MKFIQIAKENGLHVVRFENGETKHLTDAELDTLKGTGEVPAVDGTGEVEARAAAAGRPRRQR